MATGASLKSAQVIAQWDVPVKGILRNLPMHRIPADALYDAVNCVWREGTLQTRPGETQFAATDFVNRVTGAFNTTLVAKGAFQVNAFDPTAFQEVGNLPSTLLMAVTTTDVYAYFAGIWNKITGTLLTAQETNLTRLTSLSDSTGASLTVCISNGVDPMQTWDTVSASVTLAGGTPPLFTDITTASDRIIGIIPPYTIRWGNPYVTNTWPAANVKALSDTPDPVIAVRNLGTLGFVVYKQRTIWIGIPQGGLDATYFRFEIKGFYEGPANPACVVDVDGAHYYMSSTGRIGIFDGIRQTWINEALLPILRTDLDQSNMARAFGVFEPTRREVYFFYPRVSDTAGNVTGLAIVVLPKPFSYEGIYYHSCWRGNLSTPVSAGIDLRLDTNDALLFEAPLVGAKKSYRLLGSDDHGTAISGYWQPGLLQAGQGDPHHAEGLDLWAVRGQGNGAVTVQVMRADVLDAAGGTASPSVSIDLTQTPQGPNVIPSQVRGRFFGLKCSFTTPVTLQYSGARLYGSQRQ